MECYNYIRIYMYIYMRYSEILHLIEFNANISLTYTQTSVHQNIHIRGYINTQYIQPVGKIFRKCYLN